MKWLILIALLLGGCANVSTTRIELIGADKSRFCLEMPKEVEAKDLKVSINPKNGSISLSASVWKSRNVDTISAQGKRESAISGGVTEGIVEGAIKGAKGL